MGLRGSENDSALKLRVEYPKMDEVSLPFQINWSSTLPLGLLRWHSSIDGDLGTEFGGLGTGGVIDVGELGQGTHLITVLAYSEAPTTRRQAVSFLVTIEE